MQDLITIVVPVFNVEKYLEDSIKSIISQTYNNIEILAINDGSTDNSLKILKKLSIEDKRIKIISQENKGLSGARNTGIENAKGKYILFLDSDDVYSNNQLLEKLYTIIQKNNSDIVFFKYKAKSEKTKKEKIAEITLSKENYNLLEFIKELKEKNNRYYNFISACTKLYKKELFCNLRFKEGIYYEDTEIFLKLLIKSKKISFFNEVGIDYRTEREDSITTSSKRIDDMLEVGLLIENFYKELSLKDQNIIRDLADMILNNLYFAYFLSIRNFFKEIEKNNYIEDKLKKYMLRLDTSIIRKNLFFKNLIIVKTIKILGLKNSLILFKLVFKILNKI